MKTFFLLITFCSTGYSFAQPYDVVEKVNKKCQIVAKDDLYGLVYNNVIVEEINHAEYETSYSVNSPEDRLIVFYTDSGSVCWGATGQKILEFSDAKIFIGEWRYFITVSRTRNSEYQTALYTKQGKEIVPFGMHEFDNYDNGIIVKNQKNNRITDQAFYGNDGVQILPYSTSEILMYDEYNDIMAVSTNGVATLLLTDRLQLPKNTNKLNDFTFVRNTEVSIGEYLTFVGSQKYDSYLMNEGGTDIVNYNDLRPDTNKVEAKFLPLYRSIFRQLEKEETLLSEMEIDLTENTATLFVPFKVEKAHKSLLDFPVSGITHQQAQQYCSWLSLVQGEYESGEYTTGVKYRLPTEKEWVAMAEQGLHESQKAQGMIDSVSTKNCITFIYKTSQQCPNYAAYMKASKGGGSVPVFSANPDLGRRFHTFGNVAEMIEQDGWVKGGSYAQPANQAKVLMNTKFTGPQPWIGFRIVGEYELH